MVAISVGVIPNYVSDPGLAYPNLRFKIRSDKLALLGYQPAPDNICSGGGSLFKHRYVLAEYPDRSKIRYPVPVPDGAEFVAAAAIADGAVCVHLEGEEWTFIPPQFAGVAGGNFVEYPIDDGPAQIDSGVIDYISDLLGEIKVKFKVELLPNQILTAVRQCSRGREAGNFPCTVGTQIKPRALTVIAKREGDRLIARKAINTDIGQPILQCTAQLLAAGFCVRYKGESARNLQTLLGLGANQPQLP